MYLSGTSILYDLISSVYYSEIALKNEISNQISILEVEAHKEIEDIVRLPLKLPFPSISIKPHAEPNKKIRVVGPDGNVI